MIKFADNETITAKVLVIGIGGAVLGVLNTINAWRRRDIETVFIDTDIDAVRNSLCLEKFHLKKELAKQLDTDGKIPDFVEKNVINELESFVTPLPKYEIVFIVTGLGGGTGTNITPYVAQVLKKKQQWIWSLMSLPFFFEGKNKILNSLKAYRKIQSQSDAVLVIPHDKIFKMTDKNISMHEAFVPANNLCVKLIDNVEKVISPLSWINIGVIDIKKGLGDMKSSSFGSAEAHGENRIEKAFEAAASDPLLGKDTISRMKNLIVCVHGGEDLKLDEVERGIKYLHTIIPKGINVGFGVTIDKLYTGKIEVGLITLAIDKSLHDLSSDWDLSIFKKDEAVDAKPGQYKTAVNQGNRQIRVGRHVPNAQQITLDFKNSFKGRFDKSKPTEHEGEDLDVPTFLRRKKA